MQSRIRPNHLGIFVYVFVGTRMFEICKQYLYYTYLRINTVCGKSPLSTEAVKKMWLMQHIIVALLKKNKKSVVLSTGIGNFWNIYIHAYIRVYPHSLISNEECKQSTTPTLTPTFCSDRNKSTHGNVGPLWLNPYVWGLGLYRESDP